MSAEPIAPPKISHDLAAKVSTVLCWGSRDHLQWGRHCLEIKRIMADKELSGAEAVDAAIAKGVDLDGSPSPE